VWPPLDLGNKEDRYRKVTMTLDKSINELPVVSIIGLYMTLGLWGANNPVGAYNSTINKIEFEL
jgi:hypothetical protein